MRALKKEENNALERAKTQGYLVQDLGISYETVRRHRKWCEQNGTPVASIRGRGKRRQVWFEVDMITGGWKSDHYSADQEEIHLHLVELLNSYSRTWYGGACFPCFIVFGIPAESAEILLLEVIAYWQQIFMP